MKYRLETVSNQLLCGVGEGRERGAGLKLAVRNPKPPHSAFIVVKTYIY